jgi:hypothetical protein
MRNGGGVETAVVERGMTTVLAAGSRAWKLIGKKASVRIFRPGDEMLF